MERKETTQDALARLARQLKELEERVARLEAIPVVTQVRPLEEVEVEALPQAPYESLTISTGSCPPPNTLAALNNRTVGMPRHPWSRSWTVERGEE